jgi:hypothetical protein
LPRAIGYALGLYLLLFVAGNALAADVCKAVMPNNGGPTGSFELAQSQGYTPLTNCATTIEGAAACGITTGDILNQSDGSNGAASPDCWIYIELNNTCAAAGKTEVDGLCEDAPPDPCGDASADDFVINEEISNPGLCELDDYEERTQGDLCVFSETAVEYCDFSLYEEVEWISEFPTVITYGAVGTYGSSTCSPEDNGEDWEFDECDEPSAPPPTCPEGTIYNSVTATCETPSDTDGETPTPGSTAIRDTTTVTTTETVDNGDGTFTTTATTTTTVGDCPSGETCIEGIDYEGPGDLETKTFKEALDAFWDDIQNAPILAAANNIEASIPESPTCPTWTSDTIPIIDDTVVMEGHCLAIDGHEDTIQDLMLIVYSLIGLFILLSA